MADRKQVTLYQVHCKLCGVYHNVEGFEENGGWLDDVILEPYARHAHKLLAGTHDAHYNRWSKPCEKLHCFA